MTTQAPQLVAKIATTAIISIGAKDNATKLARAKIAAQVAAFFTAAGQGNIAALNQEVSTAIGQLKDPGFDDVAQSLWSVGEPFLEVELAVTENTPVFGGSLADALTGVGAGMAEVAGRYISAYGTSAPKAE
jgi:hypothetical protein